MSCGSKDHPDCFLFEQWGYLCRPQTCYFSKEPYDYWDAIFKSGWTPSLRSPKSPSIIDANSDARDPQASPKNPQIDPEHHDE